MALEILHFSNQRHDNQDFATVMASARDISRFGGGPITQSYMHFRSVRKQNLEYLQRCDVKKRLQSWPEDWLMQNFELSKDFTFANYQNHQDNCKNASSANENDEDDFDHGALINRADQRDCSSITTQSWSYGPTQAWQSSWQDHWWESPQKSWNLRN